MVIFIARANISLTYFVIYINYDIADESNYNDFVLSISINVFCRDGKNI